MSTFKTSINIKYDLGKKEVYNRYIPTSAHSEVLKGVINGINNEGNRSHIAIGPYGTGKSLITTLIAGIVSKCIDENTFNILIKKFNNSDEDIVEKLVKLKKHKKIIPVIFNGSEGGFEEVVLNKIFKELEKENIKINTTNIHINIIDTIEDWDINYPLLFSSFELLLSDTQYHNLDEFKYLVSSKDKDAINWFIETYPSLTGGNVYSTLGDKSFMAVIEEVFEQLEKMDLGIFLIYDEFGRFLQTLPENKIKKTMGLLQDLAEFIDHETEYSHLLLITHKHLSNYFSQYDDDLKSEFNRIEKRFNKYEIKNDQETFFDIANEIINNYNIHTMDEKYISLQISMLRKYNLFEYNQTVIKNKIINGCYPIHPVSIYLLSKLSALFGQNERTLFTFLESEETGGLKNHINNNNDIYFAYKLFDYFFSNLNIEDNPDYVKKYIKLERRIEDKNEDKLILTNILKFITLWEETKSNTVQKLTTEFLNYVFNKNIEVHIEKLSQLKLLRFNRLYNKWDLFEGSYVNINKKIDEVKQSLIVSYKDKIDLLNKLNSKKFYFSEQYNHDRSINRFTKNIIVTTNEIVEDSYSYNSDADLHLFIILKNNEIDIETVKKSLLENNNPFKLFCLTEISIEKFNDYFIKWHCIDYLLNDKEFYNQDMHLKDELQIELKDIEFELLKLLKKLHTFDKSFTWFYNGLDVSNRVISENNLSNFLSNIFEDIYQLTPEIKNEMFNRKHISKQQLNAAKKLINHIIKNPLKTDFGIEGNGPDYLIYATVFKHNNLLTNNESEINDIRLKKLYNRLISKIQIKRRSEFKELVQLFSNPPFGIRKPVIPVLLVGLLKNRWNYMMFFSKGTFIPNITGDYLYNMIEHPEDFEYIVFEYDESYTDFFETLNIIFEEHREVLLEDKPLHIRVAAAMLKWLQSLPKITQTTDKLSKELLEFRQNIKRIEIDPYTVFKQIRTEYNIDCNKIGIYKIKLDNYFFNYQLKLEEKITSLFDIFKLKDWVKLSKKENPNNLLLQIIEKCDYELNISVLSEDLIGVYLKDWTEQTEIIFFNEVYKQLKDVENIEFDPDKHIKITINEEDTIIQKSTDLSTKAKLIKNNIYRILDTQGKFITMEELDYLIYNLIKDYLK